MAKTKAELLSHQLEYHRLIASARLAQRNGQTQQALELAESSWPFIDGMMQYERKYENRESFTIDGIEIAFKLAPLLLQLEILDRLEALLLSQRRIAKNATTDVVEQLSAAKQLLSRAHRLWDHLEQFGKVQQDQLRRDLGGSQDEWRALAEVWESMGFITRFPSRGSYRLSLVTEMDAEILGKCPACGNFAEAPKILFLETTACPECHADVMYVLLGTKTVAG
ncbi:MAG: hypothetical protein V4719_31985 [Planctomycetota bacterium]